MTHNIYATDHDRRVVFLRNDTVQSSRHQYFRGTYYFHLHGRN